MSDTPKPLYTIRNRNSGEYDYADGPEHGDEAAWAFTDKASAIRDAAMKRGEDWEVVALIPDPGPLLVVEDGENSIFYTDAPVRVAAYWKDDGARACDIRPLSELPEEMRERAFPFGDYQTIGARCDQLDVLSDIMRLIRRAAAELHRVTDAEHRKEIDAALGEAMARVSEGYVNAEMKPAA